LLKSSPLKLGLTGGIGSGKSTVALIFGHLGVPIFDSDIEAKNILVTNQQVITKVKNLFGKRSYVGGQINRTYLSSLVFKDNAKRESLGQIVHPEVRRAFDTFCNEHPNAPYVIKEAAILIESGAYQQMDFTALVTAPLEMRIQRVINRDNTSREQVLRRINAQSTDEEKRPFVQFEITNDNESMLIPQILHIHNMMLRST